MSESRSVIKTNLKNVFTYWLLFTTPFHKLTPREVELMSLLLYYRYKLSEEIKSEEYLNGYLFGTELRKKIREELGIKVPIFQNLLTKLRSKKVLINNSINKAYIPKIAQDTDNFRIVFDFRIEEEPDDKG